VYIKRDIDLGCSCSDSELGKFATIKEKHWSHLA